MEYLTTKEKVAHLQILNQKKIQARLKIYEKLNKCKLDRDKFSFQIEKLPMVQEIAAVPFKRNEIQYAKQVLDEYNHIDEAVIQIKCLFHRLKSGRNPLKEEKKILGEIKCAQQQNEKFYADIEAQKKSCQHMRDVLNSKESIKNRLNHLYSEAQGISKLQRAYHLTINQLKKRLAATEKDI